ncbi:hypothetical protein SESBI_09214 [Sesbania bispinosa]|nr:hypothetical protein SESBI_09214 [Sesbania bispinosa]
MACCEILKNEILLGLAFSYEEPDTERIRIVEEPRGVPCVPRNEILSLSSFNP